MQDFCLSLILTKGYQNFKVTFIHSLHSFKHGRWDSVSNWRKVGCGKKFSSGHMAGRWQDYSNAMRSLAEAVVGAL